MSDEFSREELETELWQLRSVEIDHEVSLERIKELEKKIIVLEGEVSRMAKNGKSWKDETIRAKEGETNALRSLDLEREKSEKLRKERDWALKKLDAIEQAEHMQSTYGFEISQGDSRKGKNWRLNR